MPVPMDSAGLIIVIETRCPDRTGISPQASKNPRAQEKKKKTSNDSIIMYQSEQKNMLSHVMIC